MFSITDYDYDLPPELVAQQPLSRRDNSRLLRLCRRTGRYSHHRFYGLADFLSPGDVLVVNNTRVVPGRLVGTRDTGGRVEALILDYPGRQEGETTICRCLVKASRRLPPGARLDFAGRLPAEVVSGQEGVYEIRFYRGRDFTEELERSGRVPLPPYIHRADQSGRESDRADYQTVYAAENGAVAAPTAGLHFTDQLLQALRERGVTVVSLTLHVGYGTFQPVRVTDIRQHQIHRERFAVGPDTAAAINRAVTDGGRVVAVGTTVVRVLEYLAATGGEIRPAAGECDLFIYPGFDFKVVNAMVTNFHLPRSTLLMLVSAFAGRDYILAAYQAAIREEYRFYSYGDAMLIA